MGAKKRWWSRLAMAGCMAVLLALALAACGGKESGNTNNNNGANAPATPAENSASGQTQPAAQEPTRISIMVPSFDAEPLKNDDPRLLKVQELTNTRLDLVWVPGGAYNDKVNVTIASGEIPQVVTVIENKSPSIINAARSGLFWEIGPYLQDYENLSKLNEGVLNNISVDGKIYGLYRERQISRYGIIYRKDWLDNVGLSAPKTIDDLYNMLKAFTLNDPDQNQKNDTFGLSANKDMRSFDIMLGYHGAPSGWDVTDGKFTPDFMTKEYMDTMLFFKRLYDEGLMNADFAIASTTHKSDYINNSKAGVYMDFQSHVIRRFEPIYKTNPQVEFDVVSRIQGPKGERLFASNGHNGIFVFPKTSVKTEEELRQILAFFDRVIDEDIYNLLAWGIEGEDYSVEDGKKVIIERPDDGRGEGIFQLALRDKGSELVGGGMPDVVNKSKMADNENAQIAVHNPAEPLLSNTYAEKGSQLDTMITDARIKFIMGELNEADFQAVVNQWKSNGGDQIIAEYEQEYAKAQGN